LQLLVDASEAAVFSGQLAKVVELSQRASSLQAATARDRLTRQRDIALIGDNLRLGCASRPLPDDGRVFGDRPPAR